MELLRIKAYQPFACYRKPFSYGFWDTYPLPPFSTILGWVHWILGESYTEEKLPMNIGLVGRFDTITYDLQALVKFDRTRKEREQIILDDFQKALTSSPTYVANVTNIYLRIYIQMEKKYMELFKEKVFLVNYPSLGRYEDLLRIDEVGFITPKIIEIGGYDDQIPIDYCIYLKPEMVEKTRIKGSNFLLPFYHKQINDLRFFEKEKVVFTDSGNLGQGEYVIDDEKDEIFKSPVLIQLFGKYGTN